MQGLSPNRAKRGRIWRRDGGWLPVCNTADRDRDYPEPVEGLRFRVASWREIRRDREESIHGFGKTEVRKKRTSLQLIVFKGSEGEHFS